MKKDHSAIHEENRISASENSSVFNGYGIFDFDGTGMLQIEKTATSNRFADDEEAVEQAIKDGVKIIPVADLPENFDRKYLGWIDTEENRNRIANYCNRANLST